MGGGQSASSDASATEALQEPHDPRLQDSVCQHDQHGGGRAAPDRHGIGVVRRDVQHKRQRERCSACPGPSPIAEQSARRSRRSSRASQDLIAGRRCRYNNKQKLLILFRLPFFSPDLVVSSIRSGPTDAHTHHHSSSLYIYILVYVDYQVPPISTVWRSLFSSFSGHFFIQSLSLLSILSLSLSSSTFSTRNPIRLAWSIDASKRRHNPACVLFLALCPVTWILPFSNDFFFFLNMKYRTLLWISAPLLDYSFLFFKILLSFHSPSLVHVFMEYISVLILLFEPDRIRLPVVCVCLTDCWLLLAEMELLSMIIHR